MGKPAATDPEWEFSFLQGLLDGMRCGVLAIDASDHVVLLNGPGARILGLSETPTPGIKIQDALPDYPQIARVLTESFSMSHLPNRAELELDAGVQSDDPEQPRRTIGFTLSMVGHDPQAPTGVAMFFKDLTQIEQREEQDRLKDRLAALGQMAASMAHEIRNPLAGIEVTCSLLRRRLEPESEGMEMLRKIQGEVHRLNATITSSLEFVKPLTMTFEVNSLTPAVEQAIEVARERGKRPGVTLEIRTEDLIEPFLMDRSRLRQVLENLVLNAVEAVADDGTIVVTMSRQSDPQDATLVPYRPGTGRWDDPWMNASEFAVIEVSDDGPGIPKDRRDRIFYPFFTTKERGSGVGLSNVKKIVDAHHGWIDVEDATEEGGTRFTMRLPMVFEEPEE